MTVHKKASSICKPPEPWYHEPVRCHKVPEEYMVEAVTLKVVHLTKHKDNSFFTFTVKCDYGPYAYFAINMDFDVNKNLDYITLEANIGLYRYRHTVSAEAFGYLPPPPDSNYLNYLIINTYQKLLKSLGHPLYYCSAGWKVEYDEAELRGFRSSYRKEE